MTDAFVARCDVFYIDFASSDPPNVQWRLSATISDPTGSFTALDVTTGDKIIMRGFSDSGVMVYDAYRVVTIYGANATTIEILIEYELPIDADGFDIAGSIPQMYGNEPITGSFPIGNDLFYKDFVRAPSTYQHLIDPDYAAWLSNVNFEQVVEEVGSVDYGLVETPNGVLQRFTTAHPFVPGSTALYVNGVRQSRGTNLGYIEELVGSDWTLWIYFPPEADTYLMCEYLISQIV